MNQQKCIAAWMALVLVGCLGIGCTAKKTETSRGAKKIEVYHEDCTVDSDKLKVRKHLNDTVRWKYADPFPALGTITFVKGPTPAAPLTPCVDSSGKPVTVFHVQGSQYSETCNLPDKPVYGEYKYTVKIENGCTGPDPSVDVQN